MPPAAFARLSIVIIAITLAPSLSGEHQDVPRFRSGIDLINVTATVTDKDGRFSTGLRKEDFSVFEDGKPQSLSLFTRERVPVSLGIMLDVSGSMTAEKLTAAKTSIGRLIADLLGKEDELFFVAFGYSAILTQEWTTDRRLIGHALKDVSGPTGDTALYDAIALALPTAQSGKHAKKALLVISDGHDTRSVVSLREVRQAILESDVLVYALGIGRLASTRGSANENVHADALRQLTDETGGRTEVVRSMSGLDKVIERLADELRYQYLLGYSSNLAKDGLWHSIRVEVRDRGLRVRARRGYLAP